MPEIAGSCYSTTTLTVTEAQALRNDLHQDVKLTKVLLVDQVALFRAMLKDFIQAHNIVVVADVSLGMQAIQLTSELHPELVVLDISLPDCNGLNVLRSIKETSPDTRAIVLTTIADEQMVRMAVEYGADGFFAKDITPVELLAAIQAVGAGVQCFSQRVRQSLRTTRALRGAEVSPRDEQVLSALVKGLRDRDIARRLEISPWTVRMHLRKLFAHFGVQSRTELLARAVETGWVAGRREPPVQQIVGPIYKK